MDLQVDYWLVGGNRKDINKVGNPQEIYEKCSKFISPQTSYIFLALCKTYKFVSPNTSYMLVAL